ncbi:hypothetical protein CVT25_010536 [Psilocybe cyanescens]|uniref:Uncharacterized protein n=1 Tax=Psilocybe cyanescens TaxID=93625 RepID=A0A409XGT6_PSICY|nr:hypothetical protein CVT25_010536 [Psilocybe cyanescens]
MLFVVSYALIITVRPQTLVGTPILVPWNVEPSDADVQVPAGSDLIFDLRFVQDAGDAELAIANMQPAEGEDAGTALVTFLWLVSVACPFSLSFSPSSYPLSPPQSLSFELLFLIMLAYAHPSGTS